jgi:hypothetical protein
VKPSGPNDAAPAPGDRGETGGPPGVETVAVLQVQIAALEARAQDLEADLERERGETARERSEHLQERERADRLTDEVANLARQFATAVQDAGMRESALRADLARANETSTTDRTRADAAASELATWKARPWWRRLAG